MAGRLFRQETGKHNICGVFCFPDGCPARQAKHWAKFMLRCVPHVGQLLKPMGGSLEQRVDAMFHNTRSLNAKLTQSLHLFVGYDAVYSQDHVLDKIQERVQHQPRDAARTILHAMKCSGLIASEYNIFELLPPHVTLNERDFEAHKIHQIVFLVLNMYIPELREKQVFVSLQECHDMVSVHFESAKAALIHVFDNLSKYALENTKPYVEFKNEDGMLACYFDMQSLAVGRDESDLIYTPGYSGEEPAKHGLQGKGLGMGIIKRMMELNHGSVQFIAGAAPYGVNGREYAENTVVLRFRCA